jgi:hypothetical protein
MRAEKLLTATGSPPAAASPSDPIAYRKSLKKRLVEIDERKHLEKTVLVEVEKSAA